MSYNCQYSLFNLLCIFIYIVNYHIRYVIIATNAPGDSTILSRRYNIPFGYSDILFMIINIYELYFVV